MLKSELIEKLKDIEDDADINEAILALDDFKPNKDIDLSKLTTDQYKTLLETNEVVKAYYQSQFDTAISTAVNDHDEKFMKEKFPQLLEDEIKKRDDKNKTPEQIQLEKMQTELENMKKENAREKSINKYSKILADKKLPAELIDFVIGEDDTATEKNIETFNTLIGKITEDSLKNNAAKPSGSGTNTNTTVDADTQLMANAMGVDISAE